VSLFVVLLPAAAFLLVTAPFYRRRKLISQFDPGLPPGQLRITRTTQPVEQGILLGSGVYWRPDCHPNPHMLIVGGSGSGKSWTLALLARALAQRGCRCVLFDFHGDLIEEATAHRIGLDSPYGVNPLAVSLDPVGGGPDPQRFEVLDQLKNAFRPMGPLQIALLDECLKEIYAQRAIVQGTPSSWALESMTDFSNLQRVLEDRILADPKDQRAQGLRSKLSLAFDFRIFSKPQVPLPGNEVGGHLPECRAKAIRLDFSKLPASLQYLAADTLLKQILRRQQLAGFGRLSLYLLIDESKLCTPAKKDDPLGALNRIATEGRKFGLGLILSSQFAGHIGRDVLVNTFTKIVMKVDKTEIGATARRFRIDEALLQSLTDPGDAVINFADSTEWKEVRIARN